MEEETKLNKALRTATIIGIFVIAMQTVSICCDIIFGTKKTDENMYLLDYNLTMDLNHYK